jgi:hypothetical protein
MVYVYGFFDGNSVQAVAEYQRCFPNRRIPTRRVTFGLQFLYAFRSGSVCVYQRSALLRVGGRGGWCNRASPHCKRAASLPMFAYRLFQSVSYLHMIGIL